MSELNRARFNWEFFRREDGSLDLQEAYIFLHGSRLVALDYLDKIERMGKITEPAQAALAINEAQAQYLIAKALSQ